MNEPKRTVAYSAKRIEHFKRTFRKLGVPLDAGTKILDLGCGAGRLVRAGREEGLQFFGAGTQLEDAFAAADREFVTTGVVREIPWDPYRIPFDDCFFDVVYSDQVFEHVMDYPTTLREMHRVLKPGGCFLHLFPPRSMPIEPHVWVPLGTVLRTRWWLRLWASLGIRNEFQRRRRLSAAETSENNFRYLTTRTNYLPKRELYRQFGEYFEGVRFVEAAYLESNEPGSRMGKLSRLPFAAPLYGLLRNRVLFGRRPAAERLTPALSPAA